MRVNTAFKVKNNGKIDVSLLYALADMSEYGYDNQSLLDNERRKELNEEGWTIEDYIEDSY